MATRFITVSIEIMHDKNLTHSQKFILAEIEQLASLEKGCIATNEHFAELIGIAKESVSRSINDLKDKGYINIEIVNGSRNHTRIITINNLLTLNKTSRPPKQNVKTPLTKDQETKENIQVNKTKNKTIKEDGNDFIKQVHDKLQDYPNINQNAFYEWFKYKKYKKMQGVTLTLNMLNKYDYATQQQMVDTSIMNEYAGLFPPKQKRTNTERNVNTAMSWLDDQNEQRLIDVK
jgi:biotin operon repressor